MNEGEWTLAFITAGGPVAALCLGIVWEWGLPWFTRWRRIRREWPHRIRREMP